MIYQRLAKVFLICSSRIVATLSAQSFCKQGFQSFAGQGIKPKSEATHGVRSNLRVIDNNANKAIGPAVVRQPGPPSNRTIAVETNQVLEAIFLVRRPVENNDPAVRQIYRFNNLIIH
jgi:hypothetical protein